MPIQEGYTTFDGFQALTKGMNSGLDPLLLDSNGQFAYGVNVTTRGGFVKTRPGFMRLGSLGSGTYQGGTVFALDESDHLVFAVSGSVYARNGETGLVSEVASGMSPAGPLYFTQVYRWVVVQDGVHRPVVVQESGGVFSRVARDSVLDGPPPTDEEQSPWVALSIGTIGAYAHGRYHFVPTKVPLSTPELNKSLNQLYYTNADDVPTDSDEPGRACFVSSDVLDPVSPLSVFRMTEHRVLAEGGAYALPAELGFIHGMGAMRGASTGTGVGSLFVFGSRGVSAFEVSSPRASLGSEETKSWKDIAFSQVAFYGAGTYSPRSIVNVNDDLWYVDSAKHLRSVAYDSSQLGSSGYAGSALFNTTKSFESSRWVRLTSDAYRPYISSAVADNRLHWTLCDGKAIGSLDFAQSYTVAPADIPALHEGVWTGFQFEQVFGINGALHAVVSDGGAVHLLKASDQATTDPGDTPIQSFLVTKMYTGLYNETYHLRDLKVLRQVDLLLAGIARDTTVSVYFRPLHYSGWSLLGTQDIHVPSGGAQVRTKLKFIVRPESLSSCNGATREPMHLAHGFQFRIVWTGNLQIDRFTVVAPVQDETSQPQCQVDNPDLVQYPEDEFHDFDYEVKL